MKRGIIAMSGGVDSSVAALLMTRQGDALQGVTLLLQSHVADACGSGSDADDAAKVCQTLGIPHESWDLRQEFAQQVQDRFCACYRSGGTPNPCIDCNRYLKFGAMLDRALAEGWDYIASGHYARVLWDEGRNRWVLKKGLDESKDQSYVLYALTQHQLEHLRLPLGEYSKTQVREMAAEQGFSSANRPESQDICFVPDGDYTAFLQRHSGEPLTSGNFVLEADGRVLGKHRGMEAYTIGQRKGLGISWSEPLYVVGKDMTDHSVHLGRNEDLFRTRLEAGDCNWIAMKALTEPMRVTARTRYHQTETPATISPLPDGGVEAVFDQPIRAITPGQAVVFYQGDLVVGGGTIR